METSNIPTYLRNQYENGLLSKKEFETKSKKAVHHLSEIDENSTECICPTCGEIGLREDIDSFDECISCIHIRSDLI